MPALIAAFLMAAPHAAQAHPHVWVTVKAELLFEPSGKVKAIRQHWTFDEGYSSFAIQGLDTNKDGIYSREELAELAQVNTDALAESGFFTVLKLDGKRADFGKPSEEWLEHDGKVLTLHYLLPLATPASAKRTLILDVNDPTFFVDFSYAEIDQPVTLTGGGAGCAIQITRPKKPDMAMSKLSEDYFANANMGLQFASKVIVACP
ncbi:DUF1007 family protein [uncultured Alsobacter sp.]|uniref:DUF1007 family protein n=1 Tax=uncultured Alsobacter sp. TaxID=1748258 RepID=UPI0025D07EB6|nr:DUF1007 family protein [uncultured Alsobacter sp.]